MAFRLSTSLLELVDIDGATDENAEMFELERSACETKLHFRRQLVVNFNNGTKQVCRYLCSHRQRMMRFMFVYIIVVFNM